MRPNAYSALLVRAICQHLFVHAGSVEMPEFAFDDLPLEVSSIPHWKEQLDQYGKARQLYPASVLLGGVPFGLGTDYDEACCGFGVSSLYDLVPSGRPEDLLRDRIVLLVDAPERLERLVYEAGAFTALCRNGAKVASDHFNWEACISLSAAYPADGLVERLALDTGGADVVVSYDDHPFSEDMREMARVLGSLLVHVGDVVEPCATTIAKAGEDEVMHQIMALVRRSVR
ncbi:MAG: hypothetical protein SPF89_00830 [Sphaerochaetaceae bacterium]|nr:hypothetical protein [Spirochaetales bacterium]MDY5498628.1 hypothetical protein [Sphaerochaetaceae bacterium]